MPTFTNNITDNENAIEGISVGGRGLVGMSQTNYGIRAVSKMLSGIRSSSEAGIGVEAKSNTNYGVVGGSTTGTGVWGIAEDAGVGVQGSSNAGHGVYGKSVSGHGVWGESDQGSGAVGIAKLWHGVYGETHSTTGGAGVCGEHKSMGIGVFGKSVSGAGVWGSSDTHEGVHAETKSTTTAAVAAYQMNASSESAALFVKHQGNRTAALFEGKVMVIGDIGVTGNMGITGDIVVTGDIRLANADCAEDFDIADDAIEAGTVMVLGEDESLHRSCYAYDKRVAGVVSGAGEYKPGIVLDKQDGKSNRMPIALLGKVYCKVDAGYAPIEVGDLLTTSPSPGHAMKASDHMKAFGAVIGKALRPLNDGQGLIPILIALQ